MAFDLINACLKTKNYRNNKKTNPSSPFALYLEARYLIIRLRNFEFMKTYYRLIVLAIVFASFSLIMRSSLLERISSSSSSSYPSDFVDQISYDSMNNDQVLSILFRDLTNEGLMKKTQQKAVFLSNEGGSHVVADSNMDHVHLNDMEKQNSMLDNTVDFVFTSNFLATSKFVERILKIGGVVTIFMNDNPSTAFNKLSNYKIAYVRRFDAVAVAMKKTGEAVVEKELPTLSAPRKLCGYASEAKKALLQKLEDVLLEPPRSASGKSRKYLKRTRYLPDLIGDSLESYPRRVFIDVGFSETDGSDWFLKSYPTRNKNFEMYKIKTVVSEESLDKDQVPQIGMSDWLKKNVQVEEYVVMKAEAEVVEEMMRGDSIGFVDELFLECKPKLKPGNRNRRAYWECLALYGKLRDEGVVVHQWWG